MDTLSAMARGLATKGREMKVFDWEKAARIIKERGAVEAAAGLQSDWEWTGGTILRDGRIVPREDTYTYLASTWATPELEIDGQVMDCYRMESETPGWDESTYWPAEARSIMGFDAE
jgi:hypothetical protein